VCWEHELTDEWQKSIKEFVFLMCASLIDHSNSIQTRLHFPTVSSQPFAWKPLEVGSKVGWTSNAEPMVTPYGSLGDSDIAHAQR
jgi:hypothetical protein